MVDFRECRCERELDGFLSLSLIPLSPLSSLERQVRHAGLDSQREGLDQGHAEIGAALLEGGGAEEVLARQGRGGCESGVLFVLEALEGGEHIGVWERGKLWVFLRSGREV